MFNVMLVDDEEMALDLMKETIDWKRLNLNISETAVNGYQAYNKFVLDSVDIIISDIKMPIMSGLEMAQKIRELDSRVEIILVSSYEEFEYARKAIDLNVTSYLLKPVNDDELVAKLKAAIINLKKKDKDKLITNEPESVPAEQNDADNKLFIIEELKNYIALNVTHRLNLKDVAQHFLYSPNYIGQLFKKETGISFNDYVTQAKMQKAAQLLSVSQNQVADVTFQLGYNSLAYFTKVFRDYYSVTPTVYRNNVLARKHIK